MERIEIRPAWAIFIRLLTACSTVAAIALGVAFFYPIHPSEAQPGYWLTVCILSTLLLATEFRRAGKWTIYVPGKTNWLALLLVLPISVLGLIANRQSIFAPTDGDYSDLKFFAAMLVFAITWCLFGNSGPRKADSLKQTSI